MTLDVEASECLLEVVNHLCRVRLHSAPGPTATLQNQCQPTRTTIALHIAPIEIREPVTENGPAGGRNRGEPQRPLAIFGERRGGPPLGQDTPKWNRGRGTTSLNSPSYRDKIGAVTEETSRGVPQTSIAGKPTVCER